MTHRTTSSAVVPKACPEIVTIPPGQAGGTVERAMTPFGYYRLRFESRCAGPAYWFADFYDAQGEKNYADNYSGIDPSDEWAAHEGVFFARAEAVRGVTGFRAIKHPLEVRNVGVQEMTRDMAWSWLDAFRQTLPPANPVLSVRPWPRLDDVRRRLSAGGDIRWVGLGDSLSNDLLNGMGHVWVESAYPGLTLRMIHGNGPEKSARGYNDEAVLRRLVYRHRPDVLMVGGLSHLGQEDAIREIIARSRAACGNIPALFVLVDAGLSQDRSATDGFLARLDAYGAQDGFAVLDLASLWSEYVAHSPRPHAWFMRDAQHTNDRGKVILGRLFASHFE